MSEPTVCAVMLTADRYEMARKAIDCFLRQTYQNKRLLIWDTSAETAPGRHELHEGRQILHWAEMPMGLTIGELRNRANTFAAHVDPTSDIDIFVHADDDDLSHDNRIAEQVALLQSSGAEAVGYRDMLFWRTNDAPHAPQEEPDTWTSDQAWLYTNHDPRYCLGSSLAYHRSYWERNPFKPLPVKKGGTGEDTEFIRNARSIGVSSIGADGVPRMVCSIHGSNTQHYGYDLLEKSSNWSRVPDWDQRLKSQMERL